MNALQADSVIRNQVPFTHQISFSASSYFSLYIRDNSFTVDSYFFSFLSFSNGPSQKPRSGKDFSGDFHLASCSSAQLTNKRCFFFTKLAGPQ